MDITLIMDMINLQKFLPKRTHGSVQFLQFSVSVMHFSVAEYKAYKQISNSTHEGSAQAWAGFSLLSENYMCIVKKK